MEHINSLFSLYTLSSLQILHKIFILSHNVTSYQLAPSSINQITHPLQTKISLTPKPPIGLYRSSSQPRSAVFHDLTIAAVDLRTATSPSQGLFSLGKALFLSYCSFLMQPLDMRSLSQFSLTAFAFLSVTFLGCSLYRFYF